MEDAQLDADVDAPAQSDAGVETHVPAGRDARRCPHCGRPFATEERVALHVGLEHYESCTNEEVEAFRAAYEAENDDLRLYRLKAMAVLVVVYFGMLLVYALVT